MRLARLLFAPLALLVQAPSYAQGTLQDTSIMMVPLTFSYAYQLPTGNMAERFGWNNNVAFGAAVKFKSNYSLGLEGSFIFGNQVNDRGMLSGITTSNGVIVNQDGDPAKILLFERGYTIVAVAGKVIPVAGPNPNSGILLRLGGGYMRHKVLIQSQNDVVPALEDDYLQGYDRLSAGPMALFYAGYQHLSNNRLINFSIGFEMDLGFTRSLRPYDFDRGKASTDMRFDGLNGIRFGWILPIYHARDDRQFYR
jgi:hypothetical protein